MSATVTFHGSRADVEAIVARLPAILAGTDPVAADQVEQILLRGGVALLSKIQQAFIVKSRGGTDEAGISWPPLKRATIAGRRITTAEKRATGVTGRRERGLLTPAENRRWRKYYATALAWLRLSLPEGEAKARAAQIAWTKLKKEGAVTRLALFGGRQVDMLRDTGELFRSLSPGVGADAGQILDGKPGRIIVGTNKKPWHHAGIPGKLPSRPFWPVDGTLPESWWDAVRDAIGRGLVELVLDVVQREGG